VVGRGQKTPKPFTLILSPAILQKSFHLYKYIYYLCSH